MNIRFLLLSFFYFSFLFPLYSQTYFEKTYGSIYDDEAHFIETTSDGGFVVTGKSKARNGVDYDIFLLKINSAGVQEWFKVINNTGDDWGRGVRQTPDNGFIVCGELAVAGGLDYTLIKFDASGNLLWQKTYHQKANDRPSFLQITTDGSFFVGGYSETSPAANVDGFLLKTDTNGNILFSTLVDQGSNNETLYGMAEVSDGYICTGYTNTGNKGFIAKVSKTGTLLWSKEVYAGSGPNGFFQSTLYNSNIITVRGTDKSGLRDIWAYKFDLSGNMVWSKALGTSRYDEAFGIARNPNGDVVIAGFSDVLFSSYNATLVRCNDDGTLLWSKLYGGPADDRFYDVKTVGSTGSVACGYTASNGNGNKDIYILRVDNDGNAGSTCVFADAGITASDFSPSISAITGNTSNSTNSNTLTRSLLQPSIVTIDVCQTVVATCMINSNFFSPSYEICSLNPITLDAKNTGDTYLWSTGATTQTISVSSAGTYWVEITQGTTCSLRVQTEVTEFQISGNIGSDQFLCPGNSVTLHSPVNNSNYTYLWSNGSNNSSINVNTAGAYFLTISYQDCDFQTNTVNLSLLGSDLLFPNLITKNEDGKNDVLELPVSILGGKMLIVNRWGKTVYQNSSYHNEFSGDQLSDGVYYYHYMTPCDKEYKGWVQIVSQ